MFYSQQKRKQKERNKLKSHKNNKFITNKQTKNKIKIKNNYVIDGRVRVKP